MRIHGDPGSGSTQRVLCVLAERLARPVQGAARGPLEYELVPVDVAAGEHNTAAHRARQPFGGVPVLEEADGFRLYESRAIMRYLDARLPGPRLTPEDPRARALMEQWISVEHAYFEPHVEAVRAQRLLTPLYGGLPDGDVVAESLRELAPVLDQLERTLALQPFLVGDGFSLADLTFMPGIQLLLRAGEGELIARRPQLSTWWQQLARRPASKRDLGRASEDSNTRGANTCAPARLPGSEAALSM